MSVAFGEVADDGLVVHGLGALAIPVTILEVTFILETINLVGLNPMSVLLASLPHSFVYCSIAAPMLAVSMSGSEFHIPDVIGIVLAYASMSHRAD